jgi:hypothetical protein
VTKALFIPELIRAVNEISRLTPTETARLLQRTAATIRDYQKQIACLSAANDPGESDIVFELTIIATSIDLFRPEKVSAILLEAVEVIKASKILLEEKKKTS